MTSDSVLRPVKRALISVSDKSGLVEFAQQLHAKDITLLSTGGTAKLLAENGLPVIEVSEITGFPEMMDGRVKTLHPKIHGGLLGRRGIDEAIMDEHDIQAIDLLVINLYPFQKTVADPECRMEDAIENIDIGGPAMLRAAAKNHDGVLVVTDTQDYQRVLDELNTNDNQSTLKTRFDFAIKAFEHTAQYDSAIANYFGARIGVEPEQFPRTLNINLIKKQDMRYGENPHQQAAFYVEPDAQEPSLATSKQWQGKELSFNNVADTDAALECVKSFKVPACVIVKHANPCGVATGANALQAYERAYQTDPTSAFGGIIAFNETLDATTAKAIVDRQFVEVIIAPTVQTDALEILKSKTNIRVLTCGAWQEPKSAYDFKRVTGGLLVQDRDLAAIDASAFKIVTTRKPSSEEIRDLAFAWKVVKYVKSNAIVYCKNEQTIGIGAGQMSRVYSAKIAGIKAADENLQVAGSVMASDAFFPFRDGIDAAAEAGIIAVVQPGGSMRDEEVIAAANEHDMTMVFTGIRHFRH